MGVNKPRKEDVCAQCGQKFKKGFSVDGFHAGIAVRFCSFKCCDTYVDAHPVKKEPTHA